MRKRYLISSLACSVAMFAPAAANAQEIVGATAATINSGGPGFGLIDDTRNQNGLSANYTSGVTDFDSFTSTTTHTATFSGFEWFSNQGTSSASVTYDLGSILGIDAVALWNEESSGIGALDILWSTDGLAFTSLGIFNPTDHSAGSYGADVFTFAGIDARYFRFDMSGCPQPINGTFNACAIGEVAFRSADVGGAVPEPSTWAMMLFGFGATGFAMRRSRKAKLPQMA